MFSREELEKLNIHELRVKARVLGVKAPTTKKQGQLINEILQIENGELEAIKSKMGRPPKNQPLSPKEFGDIAPNKLAGELNFAPITKADYCILRDNIDYGNAGLTTQDCLGVIRKIGDKTIIKNFYTRDGYVVLKNLVDFKQGDLVEGKASYVFGETSQMVNCHKYMFKDATSGNGYSTVKVCEDIEGMYDYITTENEENKIVVEVEANVYSAFDFGKKQKLFFHTSECDDIAESYNLLLDIKNLVKNLCDENKKFALYMVDVEYIYSIASAYFSMTGQVADANAGQIFKEILSSINNSNGAKAVLFEKQGGKRSSYLDIILNKYCK